MRRASFIKEILYSVLFWLIVTNYYITTRFLGIFSDLDIPPVHKFFPEIFLTASLPGIAIGLILGLFESLVWTKFRKRISFGLLLLFKTSIYLVFFFSIIFLQAIVGNSIEFAKQYVTSEAAWSIAINLTLFSFIYNFIRQVSKKFGPGVLAKFLSGKYFRPKEEERIFLFIDLKGATTIAEKIGHSKYAGLIQDCFALLTKPLKKYNGQVYQYIGDEVVITWDIDEGIQNLNCVSFFFAYLNELEKKRSVFQKKYDLFPVFKAGMSSGKVTVAEVGEIKTEIAFLGDVLNTASRIQGLCTPNNKQFLSSDFIIEDIAAASNFVATELGIFQLKGKEDHIPIYSIEKK